MAKPFRPKRGSTAQNNAYIGLPYELTLDRDRHSLRVHDGITAGGFEILPKDLTDARYIRTVNGQTPDATGNVEVQGGGGGAGTVTSVNGVLPDATGNITLDIGDANKEEILEAARRVADVEVDPAIAEVQALQVEVARVAAAISAGGGGTVTSVNGIQPDASGNVTIDFPEDAVTSVNGQTGDVTITIPDVPVQSVNGQTGDVVITIPDVPVQSVNGMTGTVVVDTGVMTVNGNAPDASGNVVVSVPDSGVQAVNGVGPDAMGNVTIDTGVMSVNGQTGTVTLDVGVTSVNGQSGAVTIDIPDVPVQSVNGQTGAVVIDIPDVPVQSVNGQTGAIVIDTGVMTVNGNAPDASGNIEIAAGGQNDFRARGVNPVTAEANDTVTTWQTIEPGVYRFDTAGCLVDQPNQYGFLIHIVEGNSIFQQFKAQPSGAIYYRGGNSAGWRTTWRKLAVADATVASINGMTGTVTLDVGVLTVNGNAPDANGNVSVAVQGGGVSTVNGRGPDNTGNVTIDTGVMKVNGVSPTSGNVTVDVGVTSVNGQTGAVTIDIPDVPVTSVNGQTGDVVIDIPDAPVTSVNGSTGDVTIDVGVKTINSVAPDASGNLALQTNDFVSKATNPVTDVANDTTATWKALEAGVYYFNQTGCLTDQPSQYGVLTHIVNGNNVYHQFKGLPSGALYYRSGTATGWSITWTKLATADATVASVNGNTGALTALQTGCIPAVGNREQPAGYVKITNTFEPLTVTNDSLDYMMMGNRSAITVPDGTFSTAWVKRVGLNQANVSITLGDNWKWKGGVAPVTKAKSMLVLRWCTNFGVAEIVDETPIDTGVMTVNGTAPTDGNVDINVGALTVNGVSPDGTGNVTIPTGNADEILEAARRVSIVDVDVNVATIQALQTAVASLEARISALENP